MKTILLLADFSSVADNAAKYASLFTDTISARVRYPLIGYSSVKAKDAEMAINGFIAKRQMDILAIEHKKYHFFRRLFKGGLTQKASTYLRIPLLVIPVS